MRLLTLAVLLTAGAAATNAISKSQAHEKRITGLEGRVTTHSGNISDHSGKFSSLHNHTNSNPTNVNTWAECNSAIQALADRLNQIYAECG